MTARPPTQRGRHVLAAAAGVLLLTGAACDRIFPKRADLTLPDTAIVRAFYERHGVDAEYRYSGNVLEVLVQQPADELRRGGQLWARVGPYIYLFTPATRDLLAEHEGVAGVRVITRAGSNEVARALLPRGALNEITWRRAVNVLGTALEKGTERPSTMDALARFGEELTIFEYNPDYVPARSR